ERCHRKKALKPAIKRELVILPANFAVLCITPGLQLTMGIPVQNFPATIRVDNARQSRGL
ncbi:hypothetical protein, partial [Pectobacterium parmentieri]|uniref:hypothetical protein n=1 Tax=Pectobacterium parmentieri TaxID=1905730 RepID=UPI001E3A6F04